MLRKDPNKGNVIHNFRSITLLVADLRIWAKMLAEKLAFAIEKQVDKAQACVVPSRIIHENFCLMRYIMDRVIKEPSMDGVLISLDQSRAFDKVDHRYFDAVLRVAASGLVIRG